MKLTHVLLLSASLLPFQAHAMDSNERDISDYSVISKKLRDKTSKNQHSAAQAQQIKEDLLKVEREIGKFPVELLSGKKVFLLGTTGAGKSTLVNLLVKNNLKADARGRLDTQDPVQGSEIGRDGRPQYQTASKDQKFV